ncbi:nucleotide exchange factor GrpE [Micromonospora echinospora]|uniref:nucleotide exchange factor GrpE n=1 Tax=Micromonospora echinospora TaxID=1877 RepID=UPI0037B6F200
MTDKPRAADPEETPGSVPGDSATPAGGDEAESAAGLVEEAEVVVDEVSSTVDETASDGAPVVDAPARPADGAPAAPLGAELEALRAELEERTRDLQRVSAEYANYRKRVDRDRALVGEQATGAVLTALLPILDDLDRAREHGDLVGPFGTVAEQLTTALGKFGLTVFGEQGDPFDPTRHEAVAHQTSAEVSEPTCVQVMRRGYQLGERLLRPAMVAVADPE